MDYPEKANTWDVNVFSTGRSYDTRGIVQGLSEVMAVMCTNSGSLLLWDGEATFTQISTSLVTRLVGGSSPQYIALCFTVGFEITRVFLCLGEQINWRIIFKFDILSMEWLICRMEFCMCVGGCAGGGILRSIPSLLNSRLLLPYWVASVLSRLSTRAR